MNIENNFFNNNAKKFFNDYEESILSVQKILDYINDLKNTINDEDNFSDENKANILADLNKQYDIFSNLQENIRSELQTMKKSANEWDSVVNRFNAKIKERKCVGFRQYSDWLVNIYSNCFVYYTGLMYDSENKVLILSVCENRETSRQNFFDSVTFGLTSALNITSPYESNSHKKTAIVCLKKNEYNLAYMLSSSSDFYEWCPTLFEKDYYF